MNPVLILQNQPNDTPAYLQTWLQDHQIEYTIYHSDTDVFPPSIEPYSAIAVLGGAMSANDPLPNIFRAKLLTLQAVYRNIPVVGHCLGGQILASALGAEITKSPEPEIGWQPIYWIDGVETQNWLGSGTLPTHVMHWHYESFAIPKNAIRIAGSNACPNQAFVYGNHIGMQFHIEVDEGKVDRWVNEEDAQWTDGIGKYATVHSKDEILSNTGLYITEHQKTASNIYTRWLQPTCWAEKLPPNI